MGNIMTRAEYMAGGTEAHNRYYLEIALATECAFTFFEIKDLVRIKHALPYDRNLNNIPLAWWDKQAEALMVRAGEKMRDTLQARGDDYTLGVGVCVVKRMARFACEGK